MRAPHMARLVCVAACAQACASDPAMIAWSESMIRAERHLDQGKLDDARRSFERLGATAQSDADRIYAQERLAEIHRRRGDYAAAEQLLLELLRRGARIDRELRAKLYWRRARIVLDSGDRARGQALLQLLMDRFPSAAFGHRAYLVLFGWYKAGERPALIAWLQRGYREHFDSELADNFVYEGARAYYEVGSEAADERAVPLYETVLERWTVYNCGVWDDALWELSLIHHRRGRFTDELRLLEQLLSTRETTWLGSYELPQYKRGHIRIGRVYYEDLRDYDRAARQFAEYPELWPTSRFRDDVLWWHAHALRKAGRAEEAEAAFQRLITEFPDSKWARRVREGRFMP